jgi:hypothetical protein
MNQMIKKITVHAAALMLLITVAGCSTPTIFRGGEYYRDRMEGLKVDRAQHEAISRKAQDRQKLFRADLRNAEREYRKAMAARDSRRTSLVAGGAGPVTIERDDQLKYWNSQVAYWQDQMAATEQQMADARREASIAKQSVGELRREQGRVQKEIKRRSW